MATLLCTSVVVVPTGASMWVLGNSNAGANTWVAPGATSRILITYNATTYRMKYYLGDPATGVYNLRANYLVNFCQRTNNTVDGV